MIALAEVLRRHWPAYERKFGARLLPSHKRAVQALLSCHTPSLGGQLYRCDCGRFHYSYHSCNHRACPQCGHANTQAWLEKRRLQLLPLPYYLVTFTLPRELRLIRSHQTFGYDALLRESAGALLDVAGAHKNLRAQIGLLAVLQTWTRDLRYHPHVHCVVPAGGLSPDHTRWIRSREKYFLPKEVLAEVFRGKFIDALKQAFQEGQLNFQANLKLLAQPKIFAAWLRPLHRQDWVVCLKRPFGGPEYVLQYLGRYTHRVAISNHRLVSFQDGQVTFRWRDSAHHNQQKLRVLPVDAFLKRFLLHILPQGFVRIRHYGFLASRRRTTALPLCFQLLGATHQSSTSSSEDSRPLYRCPKCGGPMKVIERLTAAEIQLRSPPLVTAAA